MKSVHAAAAVLMLSAALPAQPPAIPDTIAFQGRVTLQAGGDLHRSARVAFRLYAAATGGTALWSEVHEDVAFVRGLFKVELGSVTAFPPGLFDAPALYLGMQIDTDAEMVPRTRLSAQPYAKVAGNALDVVGRDIHPRSVVINGTPVIDSRGRWADEPGRARRPARARGPTRCAG